MLKPRSYEIVVVCAVLNHYICAPSGLFMLSIKKIQMIDLTEKK